MSSKDAAADGPPRRAGWYLGIVSIAYAVPRFALDFLRRESVDPRYAALTPAQWACITTVAIGVVVLVRSRRQPPPTPYLPATLPYLRFRRQVDHQLVAK
jgi:phosphatidylglycerol:prolipoprotein diacylglycerol transferase